MKYVCNLFRSQELCYWRTVRPFLTHRGILWNNEISLIHNGMTEDGEREVSETWNQAFINIVEYISGGKLVENLSMFSNTGKNISARLKYFDTCFDTCLFFSLLYKPLLLKGTLRARLHLLTILMFSTYFMPCFYSLKLFGRPCLNSYIKFVLLDAKHCFTCGETNLHSNATKFQNIMIRIADYTNTNFLLATELIIN